MKTIGKKRWPSWVKKVIGKRKCIEIKEDNQRYYAYEYKNIWDKEKKRPTRTSKYLGVVKKVGIENPHEVIPHGIYEYGHIKIIWNILEKHGIVKSLKKIFPDCWEVLIIFALNRIIDPRPIKSIPSWYEKTYLIKSLQKNVYPKLISRVLGTVGLTWKSQTEFFECLKKDGERILYDGSVIFSTSKDNPLAETGYNKEHLLMTKINIVLAFSHDRFIPIFFRTVPGSIHDISTINILLEELGKDIILILDKGFYSHKVYRKISRSVDFISPLRRNDSMIDYSKKLSSFFIFRERPIKYISYKRRSFYIYLYEDLSLTKEEEKTYYILKSKGKEVEFKEEWAGKIAIISNKKFNPEEAYMMWKSRDKIEKSFNILQNLLDTDRPWIRKEEIFRGYIFASFLSLIIYYLILNKLKEAELNSKISVADLILELSKVYKIEIGKKEMTTEVSKTVRKLLKKLKLKNIITK